VGVAGAEGWILSSAQWRIGVFLPSPASESRITGDAPTITAFG
jgi:hypothetical protein